jgi:hypothetical protein
MSKANLAPISDQTDFASLLADFLQEFLAMK